MIKQDDFIEEKEIFRLLNPHLKSNPCMKAHDPRPTKVCMKRGKPSSKNPPFNS